MKKILLILFILLFFGIVYSSELIAFKVDMVFGSAWFQKANETNWQKMDVGLLLYEGDRIKTGTNSYCDLVLSDSGIFRLADNSTIELKVINNKKKVFKLNLGRFFLRINKREQNDIFQVETEVAAAAVLGTEFVVDYDQNSVKTSVIRGKVKVIRNLAISNIELDESIEDYLAIETEAGNEIVMTLVENKKMENLLDRVKNNRNKFKDSLNQIKTDTLKNKRMIKNIKDILNELYENDRPISSYSVEDEKAVDDLMDRVKGRNK